VRVPDHDFASAIRLLGLDLDATALDRLTRYRDAILAGSQRFNLTAIKDAEGIERRLFLDALALVAALQQRELLPAGCRVLDIGSGAGLPGLPVEIARPDLHITLLEATGKKCTFLRETIEELGLEKADVVEGRAEELAHGPPLREAFDVVIARAVAPMPVLVEYALPFLRVGGHLAAPKGTGAEREVEEAARALEELGGVVREVVVLPVEDMVSTLVLVEKTRPTPERFPRRTGIPSKRPLS
jgi:16S rRNA (guanine527-N7)-methyltransferase